MFFIYKIVFSSTLFMGTMMTISSQSWLGVWMGLEINLLSFIPLISMKSNSLSSESSIKYFLIQALASSIFLFLLLIIIMKTKMLTDLFYYNKIIIMMMNSTILLKLGAAPFHFWFPEIMEGLSWSNSLILLTWQKIAPMIIISYLMKNLILISTIIMLSTFIGSIGGLNQINLQKIMAYSSINHIGWMISAFLINNYMWTIYFLIYSTISLTIILMFKKFNLFLMKQIFMTMNKNYLIKFFIMMNFLSLGGLPPFLGFLPKWLIIQNLSTSNFFVVMFMIMMTLITLFFYLRITYSSMMIYNMELNSNILMNKFSNNKMMINFLTFISINGLILYSLFINFY
uniref:NADH-ubiquinone oxidoreductase chain 2 n=1 Tax=Paroster macrosturtensis TaxID=610277 RepID=A0A343W9X7_9DYTI|nr:NADH dehydrogenase subunit 2 [Paroster macrosturtensis]AVZ66442.1 NADH dehydrogenase subunit 2 [Paroster macrosturtensis]